jgi:hypothetical protein
MRWFGGPPESGQRWHRRRSVAARGDAEEGAAEPVSDGDPASDCAAFLLGRYAEYLEARSVPIPVWAWTNVLAHGCQDDIDRAAAGARGGWSSTRKWRVARAFVAGEVLDRVGHGASLVELQREVLVPLELELVSRRGVWAWTPQCWLETVRAALRSYRPSSRT